MAFGAGFNIKIMYVEKNKSRKLKFVLVI